MGFPKPNSKAKRPHAGVPYDKKQIVNAIGKYRGNLSKVADSVGCSRYALRRYIDNNLEVKEVLDTARERWLDDIEESVLSRANESNDTALQCFVLKTQGRHRGWEQDEAKGTTNAVANAAFEFIISKQKQST